MADTNTYDLFQKVEKWTTKEKFNALGNLTEIEKIANDRKIYFINLLELIENNNITNLTDCLQTMNCNLKKTEEELNTLKKIANSIFYC